MRGPFACAVAAAMACAAALSADSTPLVTDRPDQTESAETVPPGHIQVEIGWLSMRDGEADVRLETEEAPGTLVRLGLREGLELRLGWSGRISEDVRHSGAGSRRSGSGDAELGAKLILARERSRRPQVALLASTSVPVGDDGFSSDRPDPAVRLLVAHGATRRVGMGYNAGFEWTSVPEPSGASSRRPTFVYTAAAGVELGERLGAFIEVFGGVRASELGPDTHYLDGGLTFLARSRLQLDAAVGFGLNDDAADSFVGLGVSFRLPG